MDFATLISSFRLFISTSTGTYHRAAMVGTPTMTFFADTLFASSKRWKSISDEKIQNNRMIPLAISTRHDSLHISKQYMATLSSIVATSEQLFFLYPADLPSLIIEVLSP